MDGIETLREIKLGWPKTQSSSSRATGGRRWACAAWPTEPIRTLLKPVSLKIIVETAYMAFEESGIR
jgi:hypothetical protein